MARKESFDPHEHLSLYRDCLTEASRLGGALMEQLILDARKSLHLREQAFVDPVQLAAVRNASALLNKHAALLCESFPVLLRGEFGLETGAEKAQKPGNSSLSFDSLELMDESQVEETVELARAQQIAVQAVESRLAELDALICAAQGLRTVRADRNPLRPEVYVRTLRAVVMQTQAPAVTLATTSASSTDRLASSDFSQRVKPGTGDRVTKVSSFGRSRCSSCTTCLMRKLPKEMPRSPSWQLEME